MLQWNTTWTCDDYQICQPAGYEVWRVFFKNECKADFRSLEAAQHWCQRHHDRRERRRIAREG